MSRNSVRVTDALGATISRTSEKRAIVMISRGIARRRGSAIELIEDDHRVQQHRRKSPPHYVNGDGMATLAGIKGLPVAGDVIRLIAGKRPTQPVRDFPRVTLSVTTLPMHLW